MFMLLIVGSSTVMAQSFEKGSIHFDLGLVGIGVYGTSQTTTTTSNFGGVTAEQTNDTTDGAASFIVPIRFEYGISNRIGLGADLTFNNYFIDDEDKKNTNSVKSFDFGVRFNYHLLNSDRNELILGVGLGISSIKFDLVANPQQIIKEYSGSGAYWSLGVTDRIFFTDHIGILFYLEYKGYNYNLDTEFTPEFENLINSAGVKFSQEIDWTFNGANFGLGVALKF